MKVIFLEDLPNVAHAGDIKEVANGYAKNFLFPRKIAMVVKPGAVNIVAARQKKVIAASQETAKNLEGREVNLKARVGSKERLFGAITTADIAAELNQMTGLDIDKRKIELDKPIHELGSYEVTIRLAKDVVPRITVNVTGEEPAEKAEDTAPEVEAAATTEEEPAEPAEDIAPEAEATATEEEPAEPAEDIVPEAEAAAPEEESAEQKEEGDSAASGKD